MSDSLIPSAKPRSATSIEFLRLWCEVVMDQTLASRTPSGRPGMLTTMLCGRGNVGVGVMISRWEGGGHVN